MCICHRILANTLYAVSFFTSLLYAFDNIRYPLKDNAQKNDRAYEVPYGLKYKSYKFHYPQIT